MNVLTRVLSNIYNSDIPEELLEEAFIPKSNPDIEIKSLDHYIIESVIKDKILKDINIGNGKPKEIILRNAYAINNDRSANDQYLLGNSVKFYRIPKTARENCNITEVVSITKKTYNYGGYNQGNTYADQTVALIRSHTLRDTHNDIDVSYEGDNIVKVHSDSVSYYDMILNCYLEYDHNFINLNLEAIKPLCDLAICATKILINMRLYTKINKSYIIGGHELGTFGELVEKYGSEIEKYDELLMELRGGIELDDVNVSNMFALRS